MSGRRVINNYAVLETLGGGSYGRVKLVEELRSKQKYAMKMVPRARRRRNSFSARHLFEEDDTFHEVAILKKLDHKNVVKIMEIISASRSSKFYVVMEYV